VTRSRCPSTSTRRRGGRTRSTRLDTLEVAVRVFRDALVAEFEPYDRREQTLESLRD
jgi:hypothetical protein